MPSHEAADKFKQTLEEPEPGISSEIKPPELPRTPFKTAPKQETTLGDRLGLTTLAKIIKSEEQDNSEVPDQ